jgi:hypothetical protein
VNFANQNTGQIYARIVAGKLKYWDAGLCDPAFSSKRSRAAIKMLLQAQSDYACDLGEEGGCLNPRQNITLGEWGESRTL